jgi:hypothetical protein
MKFISLIIILNITLAVKASVPSYVPTNGLVGWWPFNGNANDESWNGNNGTVNGAFLVADRNGNASSAYEFDGINDFIRTYNGLYIYPAEISVSVWFYLNDLNPPSSQQNQYDLISTFPGCGDQLLLKFETSQNGNYIAQNSIGFCSTPFNQSNSWHHICVTSSEIHGSKIFIDGNFVGQSYFHTTPIAICSNYINFGRQEIYGGIGYLNGKLDDVGLWNRALTQQEITNLYNASVLSTSCPALPSNLQSGLVGYWPFCGNANDESGCVASDQCLPVNT